MKEQNAKKPSPRAQTSPWDAAKRVMSGLISSSWENKRPIRIGSLPFRIEYGAHAGLAYQGAELFFRVRFVKK